jgi:hypothetical protein
MSEIDPTYGLQNGFSPVINDQVSAFDTPQIGFTYGTNPPILPFNSQVDNVGVDVRLTQLRNLLSGTRSYGPGNGEGRIDPVTGNPVGNWVFSPTGTSTPPGTPPTIKMPNGMADGFDALVPDPTNPMTFGPYVVRTTPPVPGRWGEAQSIPGELFPNPVAGPAYVNVVSPNYTHPVRAGYSINIRDILNGLPPDAADDNLNTFDPYPLRPLNGAPPYGGEVDDADFYDAAGALLLPVERMRRWVVPADINGTGQVSTWNAGMRNINRGPDGLGRVEFNSYFRPPGSPGVMSTNYTVTMGVPASTNGTTLGAIYYPSSTAAATQFYGSGPNPAGITPPAAGGFPYLPDQSSNPLHGLEAARFPNQAYSTPTPPTPPFTPQNVGGSPVDQNGDMNSIPTGFPTYDFAVNATVRSDGLNDADELNHYTPNPLVDSPFGPGDLEWLYRQQDVDGATLSSRLSQLAPVSFTNGVDGARRRRLYALDSWDLNNFTWTNDNPAQTTFVTDPVTGNITQVMQPVFPTNSRFVAGQNGGFRSAGLPTPSLAHRGKKINLNYPLPVSNDPNEPIRQKWINDTYQLLKSILPPKSIDTAEELAQLSQYVINIIDFRDTDCTMTHWINPDVQLAGIPVVSAVGPPPATVPILSVPLTLIKTGTAWPPATFPPGTPATTTAPLEQWGMEYNPVALNEVLAYSFLYNTAGTGTGTRANRLFVELVNTQTSPELSAATTALGFTPIIDLGGYQYTAGDPYSGAPWDIVFTADDAYSRPDPYRGQLPPYGNAYAVTPLNKDTFNSPTGAVAAPPGNNVQLTPLTQTNMTTPLLGSIPSPTAAAGTTPATNYFYAFGNLPPSVTAGATTTSYESGSPSVTSTPTNPAPPNPTIASTYYSPFPATAPPLAQTIAATMDPTATTGTGTTSPIPLYAGVLPNYVPPAVAGNPNPSGTGSLPSNYKTKIPSMGAGAPTPATGAYYWVCLRRPANLFAPVSAANPMVVVDSVRFPYQDGTGTLTATGPGGITVPDTTTTKSPYSVQRYQPYRGGHAVPVATPIGSAATIPANPTPVDPRYGYTEQIVVPGANSQLTTTRGIYNVTGGTTSYATAAVYHTLGWANEYEQGSLNSLAEPWDYLPFNDRDFTSVAELMLVPGCSPGLFTKQFVEFCPTDGNPPGTGNVTNIFNAVIPNAIPPTGGVNNTIEGVTTGTTTGGTTATYNFVQPYNTASTPFGYIFNTAAAGASSTPQPRSYPYLNDEFFYSGYGGPTNPAGPNDPGGYVGGNAADGWFKMFEFFEVPSQSIGAIGPVAAGSNFDWHRQDIKPGQLNPNLIMDEEVFFSLAGKQSINQSNGQYLDGTGAVKLLGPTDQFAQQLLNFNQIASLPPGKYSLAASTVATPNYMLPALSTPPIPMMVTSTLANGTPASAIPIATTASTTAGMVAQDPIGNFFFGVNNTGTGALVAPYPNGNRLKAAWVQFLNLRHGGSGYIFGYGLGAVGQNSAIAPLTPPQGIPANLTNSMYGTGIPAERPFHSLSYPDINLTVMRPAALPPSLYTNPVMRSLPTDTTVTPPNYYAGDPGVRNPTLFLGYPTGSYPGTVVAGTVGIPATRTTPWGTPFEVTYPPPVPVRRLFQVPDSYAGAVTVYPTTMGTAPTTTGTAGAFAFTDGPSNAGETGDQYLNNQVPVVAAGVMAPTNPPQPIGVLPQVTYTNTTTYTELLTDSTVNLYWPGGNASTLLSTDATGALVTTPVPLPSGATNPYLGANSAGANADARQHPYWRSEQIQRIMNLTTPRTHQYAVWVTIGFFEVKRQGDLGMFAYNPSLAFDILGPEIGAANGKNTRYRGFYLVDRLRLTGFNPSSASGFRQAIVYRQRIQ